MRLLLSFTLSVFLVACSKTADDNKESEFYVRGNCEMCQDRIENAIKSVPGVSSVSWKIETSQLKVAYDSTTVQELDLHKAVAAMGHGTKLVKMDEKAHVQLPGCCQIGEYDH